MSIGNHDPLTPAADVLESEVHGEVPMPITPGENTERRAGVAFDVERGSEMAGVPAQTTATNQDTAQTVTESAQVPPGGLNPTGTHQGE